MKLILEDLPLFDFSYYIERAEEVKSYLISYKDNKLLLNCDFQKDYWWEEKEQNNFLTAFLLGLPIGTFTFMYIDNDLNRIIIDGKQRLITLIKFINGELLIKSYNKVIYYNDFNSLNRRRILLKGLHSIQFPKKDENRMLEYYNFVNYYKT